MIVYAQKSLYRQAVEIMMYERRGHKTYRGEPTNIIMTETTDEVPNDPTLVIPFDAAQQLFQELWDCGYRPNNGEGSAGQIQAMQNHIALAERILDKYISVLGK